MEHDLNLFFLSLALFLHLLGILSALHAVMNSRTSQGAAAWSIGLISFPYVSLPLYWLFGIYQERTNVDLKILRANQVKVLLQDSSTAERPADDSEPRLGMFELISELPQCSGNEVNLLVDGATTFEAIFAAILKAKQYILVEFFIVEADELGNRLKDLLISQAKLGVKVHFLFDLMGCHKLPKSYLRELRAAGVAVLPFRVRERVNRFQINFRNHRKIVVVDGTVGFVGGHNVSVEYLGQNKKFGHWRDTHIRMTGPVVFLVQAAFVADWYLTTQTFLELNWQPRNSDTKKDGVRCVVVASTPLRRTDSAGLSFTQAIHMATERVWITTPYFIPDEKIAAALRLRAMAGVDVRVLIPNMADHTLVYLAAFSYLDDLKGSGVKIYRYNAGFLHQKVMLIDHDLASVGTANLDNRSFHLNFELMVFNHSEDFNRQVAAMLENDFNHAERVDGSEYEVKPFYFKLASRVSRMFSPIL
jgi:cardiolipin synthase